MTKMKVLNTVNQLQKELAQIRQQAKSVGFVPTMGALHNGHLSLAEKCAGDNDISVVSVFVNPTQFNNKEDLAKYPRDTDKDIKLIETMGIDIVFVPSVEEIYPEPDTRQFDFGQIDKVMEGVHRPGHFNGVAQVVSRLFDIVKPDRAYFGEKDFQQLAVIREMVKQLNLQVQIIPMPIVREPSGLAMSSRNERLTPKQRAVAANIYKVLLASRQEMYKNLTVQETIDKVIDAINLFDELKAEYFDIVDGNTLQAVSGWDDSGYVVGCIAVFCGDVRLIDNIVYHS